MRTIGDDKLKFSQLAAFVQDTGTLEISKSAQEKISKGYFRLLSVLEKRLPVYGVTTGFGDSCHRVIEPQQSEELQKNLISYLLCGTGKAIPKKAAKAAFLIRLKSLSRGYSGVSLELIERMRLYLERDWIPVIPREGSLGASGDLIPLAYIAQALQGEGYIYGDQGPLAMQTVLSEVGLSPYTLKAKEGLALVNGTSTMAGMAFYNLKQSEFLLELSTICTSWLCLALKGRTEAFGELVNEKANIHSGQAEMARQIRLHLETENYRPTKYEEIKIQEQQTAEFIQDRYSLRCAPQILGPISETIEKAREWVEDEINGVADNPLFGDDGSLEMGGNFYGGYLSHGMDYLKISLAHMADLYDRQLTLLMDEKSNRGLSPNLANWQNLPENEKFLHHGLKGLHQAVSAVTSEIMAKAIPNGIFSRSTESHNQDKVSLGMSAATQCHDMIESLYTIQAMHLVCLAQGLDLRGVKLQGQKNLYYYNLIRNHVPFVARDQSLGTGIAKLAQTLKDLAWSRSE